MQLLAPVLSAASAAAVAFDGDSPWVVAGGGAVIGDSDEPVSFQMALRDVQLDWYKVTGHPANLVQYNPRVPRQGLYVGTLARCPWIGELFDLSACQLGTGPEAHCVVAANGSLVAVGNGTRGAIFALYTVAEEVLGVDPWYRFTNRQPAYVGSLLIDDGFASVHPAPRFTYRGVFTNDEDMLGYFRPDPLAESVFDLRTWDNIYETVLRLKANVVIPGTSTNPDERHLRLANRRGLAISQSHFEIAGFGAREWLDGDVAPRPLYNWTTNPDLMAHVWRAGVDAMKDLEVVWTVGLRGLWDYEYCSRYTTPERCGQMISAAMHNQTSWIRAVQPDAPIITYLWGEGLSLWKKGVLKLPEGVQLLFTDEGKGYIGGLDSVGEAKGVYYHTAMLDGSSNQLSEMIPPSRIFDQLGKFVKGCAKAFFIIDNVSDLWPVLLSTEAVLRLAWDPAPFSADPAAAQTAFLRNFSKRYYGAAAADAAAAAYESYFAIPHVAAGRSDEWIGETISELSGAAQNDIRESGVPSNDTVAKAKAVLTQTTPSQAPCNQTLAAAEAVVAAVPAESKQMAVQHLLWNAAMQKHAVDAIVSLAQSVMEAGAGSPQAVTSVNASLASLAKLFAAQRAAEGSGEWRGLFSGDRLMYSSLQARRRGLLGYQVALLNRSAAVPPNWIPGYYSFYDYQKAADDNYPLFYASDRFRAKDFVLMNCTGGCANGPDGGVFHGATTVQFWTTQCRTGTALLPPSHCPSLTLRYTTDGTEPTLLSPAYTAAVSIAATTNVSARVEIGGQLRPLVHSAVFTKL